MQPTPATNGRRYTWGQNYALPPSSPRAGRPRSTNMVQQLTPIHWAVGALILISVGRAHDHVPGLNVLRPALILTAFCILMALIRPQAIRLQNLLGPWPPKAIATIFVTSLLASFLGLSFGASASFLLTTYLPVITIFLLTTIIVRDVRDTKWLIISYTLSVILVSLASIFLSETMYFDGIARRGGAGMYDGNDIGVVLMVGLPFAIILLRSRQFVLATLGGLAILGTLISLILAASRGGFLGLLAGGAAILVLSPGLKVLSKILLATAAVFSFLFLAPEDYRSQMSTMLNPQADYNVTSETGRFAIWTRGLSYVSEYPIFGVGPDNFIRAGWTISQQGQSGLVGASLRDQAPHNTFLQVWAEMGSVGLLFWLSLLSFGVVYPLVLRRRMSRQWLTRGPPEKRFIYLCASYLPASFIGFAVTSFFVSHAYTPIFYVMTGVLTGFIMSAKREIRMSRLGISH